MGESCTSSERACGACAGARGQRSPEKNRNAEKQGCMCDESMRRRWLSSSQGFVPILATCMSFKKWVRARSSSIGIAHCHLHCGERTRREACRTPRQEEIRFLTRDCTCGSWGVWGPLAAASEPPIFTLTYSFTTHQHAKGHTNHKTFTTSHTSHPLHSNARRRVTHTALTDTDQSRHLFTPRGA